MSKQRWPAPYLCARLEPDKVRALMLTSLEVSFVPLFFFLSFPRCRGRRIPHVSCHVHVIVVLKTFRGASQNKLSFFPASTECHLVSLHPTCSHRIVITIRTCDGARRSCLRLIDAEFLISLAVSRMASGRPRNMEYQRTATQFPLKQVASEKLLV